MANPIEIRITPVTLTELTIIVESTNGIEVKTLADCNITPYAITLTLPRPPYGNVNLKFYSQGYNVGILENVSGLGNSIELTPTSDYIKTSDGTNNYYVKDNYSRKFGDDLLSIIMTKADSLAIPTAISDLTDDTSTNPIDKTKSVKDQRDSSSLKYWTGTKAQYDAIVTKDANTLYNVEDDNTADAYQAYTKSEVDSMFADVDLDNLSNVGKQEIINCVMPSTDQIDFTITTSGQIINMPESGYLQVVAYGSKSSNSFIGLYGCVASMVVPFADNVDMRGFIPVSKGESIQVYFSNATNIQVYLLKSKGAI